MLPVKVDIKREPMEVRNHLTLLAKNLEGYRNLCRLISRANIEGFYHRPRVDKELLAQYSEGIIALSGCLQGEVPWMVLNRGMEDAIRSAEDYCKIFDGRFYLEIQHNGIPEQYEANKGLIDIGKKMV